MRRYIDADALLKAINQNTSEAHNERCAQILEAILYTPTADVVEVVRCRDCKRRQIDNFGRIVCVRQGQMIAIEDNDFCSYGESKEQCEKD